jgi:hypothetical protein
MALEIIVPAPGESVSEVTISNWLVKEYVNYQYGELSTACKPHNNVLSIIEKHTLSIGYPKGIVTHKDKDKDKDKDKNKDNIKINKDCKVCNGSGQILAQGSGKIVKCWSCHDTN